MERHSIRTLVLAAAAWLVAAAPARAHELRASLDPESTDPLRVQARYDDNTPARAARVSVVRSTGEEVAAGLTDDDGTWSFPRPGPGLYRITVEAVGHKDVLRFSVPGAEEPAAAPVVEEESRLNQNLGLIIGLVLLLGGSAAFLRLRAKRLRAPST